MAEFNDYNKPLEDEFNELYGDFNGNGNGEREDDDSSEKEETDSKLINIFKFRPTLQTKTARLKLENETQYNMNHKKRGLCVIFNNAVFDEPTLSARKGTDVDAKAVRQAFENYGFEVKQWDDLKEVEISVMLRWAAKQDHNDSDCFVLVVMTHGEVGYLWGKDQKYPIDSLFEPFKADNCLSLAGKPKLFFIQACRGDKLDSGIKVSIDVADGARLYSMPTWSDFLITYSTVPGYYSWRNTSNGSWFIQSLCETMLNNDEEDLPYLNLLIRVNRKVAFEFQSQVPGDKMFDKQKQIPAFTCMLTRELILKRKPIKKVEEKKN